MKYVFVLILALGAFATRADESSQIGSTRIARWKDDRAAAFVLMFDDGWPSQWQVAVPELVKRGLVGTFYLNPAKGEFVKFRDEWTQRVWTNGMIFADHTMTHKGVHSVAEAEHEIGDCARFIRDTVPGKTARLISYGQPGVDAKDWTISPAELDGLLKKHHLITRGSIVGRMAVYHLKTAAEMLALADRAISNRAMDFIVIHGVERITPNWGYQDFWALKQDVFLPFLDGVKERRDRGDLWITDHISAHQYGTERDSATVQIHAAGEAAITLDVTAKADPELYDTPLTLITKVPAVWKRCQIAGGSGNPIVQVSNGAIRYDALPDGKLITIGPAP